MTERYPRPFRFDAKDLSAKSANWMSKFAKKMARRSGRDRAGRNDLARRILRRAQNGWWRIFL